MVSSTSARSSSGSLMISSEQSSGMPPSVSRLMRSMDMWSRVNRSSTLMGTAVSLWPMVA